MSVYTETWKGSAELSCDTPGCTSMLYFKNFKEAAEFKREEKFKLNGWRSFMGKNGEWQDACPACVKKFSDTQRALAESV